MTNETPLEVGGTYCPGGGIWYYRAMLKDGSYSIKLVTIGDRELWRGFRILNGETVNDVSVWHPKGWGQKPPTADIPAPS